MPDKYFSPAYYVVRKDNVEIAKFYSLYEAIDFIEYQTNLKKINRRK